MLMREISNDNYDEEMRQIREKSNDDNVPHQRLPVNTLYYYVERRILDTSRQTMLGVQPGTQITTFTHFSLEEGVLRIHREGTINRNSSNTILYTDDDIAFTHPLNSRIEFEISAIRPTSSARLMFQRQANSRVTSIEGTIF